jgi:hypothetical protein
MKKLLFTLLLTFSLSWIASAKEWHVAGSGNDSNDGKTPETAFRSLQKAEGIVQPGDVVWVGNGIYTNSNKSGGGAVLNITCSGKTDAWITWKARPGHQPEVRPIGWCGIQISGSYHIIDGLIVKGSNDSIALIHGQEDAKKATPDPYFNTNGIFVNGRTKPADQKPHNVMIRNCTVCKCAGGGIVGIEMDYLTVEDCKVYDNAWFMRYGGSGITTLNNWAYDDAPGYHIIIQRNFVWNNKTMVAWEKIGKLSDGNGILLDVTDQNRQGATNPNADAVVKPATNTISTSTSSDQANSPAPDKPKAAEKPKRPEWKGRALIANNLSAYNGGSGIHTFRTKHVDIINNTTYCNGQIVDYQELFPNNSEDIVILNNIIVPRPGGKVTSNNKNTNIRWDYNLYPIAQNIFKGEHDLVADPKFMDIQLDITKGNFKLSRGSQAMNSGTDEVSQPTDIIGNNRPKGKRRDRGAFEQK